MPKFYGAIGFGSPTETAPGVWHDIITEHLYAGDVLRNTRQMRDDQKVNNDISVNNSISIIGDEFATENIFAMRYAKWKGVLWVITQVDVQYPRLLLTLGGVYNGPKA